MTRLVLDGAMIEKLNDAHGRIELCDDSGRTLGFFYPTWYAEMSEQDRRGPCSDEELERRRKEPGGKPLSEILKRLEEL